MMETRLRTRVLALLCAVPFLLVTLFFEVIPIFAVAMNSIVREGGYSFGNFGEILGGRFYLNTFQASLTISAFTAIIGLGLALPIAVLLQRLPGRIQQLVLISSNIGANFTGFPLAFAFVILLGVSGSFTLLMQRVGLFTDFTIYSRSGLIIVYSYFQILLGILLVFPSLGAVTKDLQESAYLMGASRWTFWRRIGLPILAPSLIGAFLLLFANAMGTYATAWALVGGSANLVTIKIGELTAGDVFSDPNLADALAMLLIFSLIIPIVAAQFLQGRKGSNV